MVRAEVLQGVREMRFEALLDRHERGGLNQQETAEMPGIGERTFRRWRDRLRDEGPSGLRDRRIGKPSSRRAAVEEIQRMLGLYEERYAGFTVNHFHEQLVKRHNYKPITAARPRKPSPSATWPSTTPPSRSRRPRRAAPCCRPRRCGGCDPVHPRRAPGRQRQHRQMAHSPCRSRPLRCDRILCAPRCGCTSIPTVGWRSFTGRIGWPTTIPRERFATTQNWLPEPLRQPA